ncbi:hypothetical protein [Pseudomonas laurylsulfativorans]|nr:hypothetical protein [Pseudomonas laurylsulfativorans]
MRDAGVRLTARRYVGAPRAGALLGTTELHAQAAVAFALGE